MANAPDSPFDLTGTLLDIVNYVSSLDMDGVFPIVDDQGRGGRLLFNERCLRNVWLADLTGKTALQALAETPLIRCSLEVEDGDASGPLDYSYQRLQAWMAKRADKVATKAKAKPKVRIVAASESLVPTAPALPEPVAVEALASKPASFPKVRPELFRQDHDVLLFGAMMAERVQCQTLGMPGLQVKILAPLIKALQAQVEGMRSLASLVPAKSEHAGICVQAMEFPAYLVGIAYDEETPWQIFVISKKSVVLNHTVMLARLNQLWTDMKMQEHSGEPS